jgi:hypothetical protein
MVVTLGNVKMEYGSCGATETLRYIASLWEGMLERK